MNLYFYHNCYLTKSQLIMAYNLLKGKKGIIFGALNDQSIAWKIAQQCYAEGAQIVLTNAPIALRMGEINKLAEECGNAPVIAADVTSTGRSEEICLKKVWSTLEVRLILFYIVLV